MPSSPPAEITGLYRYPVKGLTPEPLREVELKAGEMLPADRRYAVENGPSGFDPAQPSWLHKTCFLMLMRNERLAALRSHFEDETASLTIARDGEVVARGNLETAEGRAAIEAFLAQYFAGELKGPPKLLSAPDHGFSNVRPKVVSIVNLDSVRAVETMVGATVHPLRFRANFYVRGWPAWHELGLVDRTLAIGEVRLKVLKRIIRCPAVDVDPDTARRDLDIVPALTKGLGHMDCGIYAEVTAPGTVRVGDAVAAPSDLYT
jgi:uncharacterized protein YcbX